MLASASVLADPVAEGRNLGAWGGTADGAGCKFESTANLFEHEWLTVGTDLDRAVDPSLNVPDAVVGQITLSEWDTDPQLLAHFDIQLKVTNYAARAVDVGTKNYQYFAHDGLGGWTDQNGLDATGEQDMVSICVYKNDIAACNEDDDVKIELLADLPSQAGTSGSDSKNVEVGVRKVLGVATTCGEGDDLSATLASTADNIFVWTTLEAEQTVAVSIDFERIDTLSDATATAYEPSFIAYTVSATGNPTPHDILFIEGNSVTARDTTIFTTQGNNAFDINYADGHQSLGGFASNNAAGSQHCELSVTVTSETTGNSLYHCYRANGETVPDSSYTEVTGADANDTLEALNAAAANSIFNAGATCGAQLEVNCNTVLGQIDALDTRDCTVSLLGVGQGTQQLADKQQDFMDCVSQSWYTEPYLVHTNEVGYKGSYATALVQAVRLRNERKYPFDAGTALGANDAGSVGTNFPSATVGGGWECDDATNCATTDPYRILAVGNVTSEQTFNGLGPFLTDNITPENLNTFCNGASCHGGAVLTGHQTEDATHTCGGDTVVPCTTDGPDYDSGTQPLVAPPAEFPEAYVFGVASFDYGTDFKKYLQPAANSQRRLGSSESSRLTKTLIVNAIQKVITK